MCRNTVVTSWISFNEHCCFFPKSTIDQLDIKILFEILQTGVYYRPDIPLFEHKLKYLIVISHLRFTPPIQAEVITRTQQLIKCQLCERYRSMFTGSFFKKRQYKRDKFITKIRNLIFVCSIQISSASLYGRGSCAFAPIPYII